MQKLPLLVSTPHSSGDVPAWIMAQMLETGEPETDLRRRLLGQGDPYTDLIFHLPEARLTLNAPGSRFVADLNRDRDEGGENGVIKLTDFDRKPFYCDGFVLSAEDREMRLSQYYDPYHRALAAAFLGGGFQFFIDGHSMTAQGPSLGPDQGKPRPAICLGNFGDPQGEPVSDPVSCAPDLARQARSHLEALLAELGLQSGGGDSQPGFPRGVLLNQPFDGGHILRKYSRAPYSVPGLMVEVNRDLYLDEATLEPLPGRIGLLGMAMAGLAAFMMGKT